MSTSIPPAYASASTEYPSGHPRPYSLNADAPSMQSPICRTKEQDLPFPPPQSHFSQASTLDELLPRFRTSRDRDSTTRPSLYHDASRLPVTPLFSRRIDWLPGSNVLHYLPVSLSPASDHLQLFTKWQSDPRVSAWWNQDLSEEQQRRLLQGVQEKDDTLGLIGYWSTSEDQLGEPWGYVEIYWAKTSSISEFYDYPTFTFGFHALVGESKFRGPDRVRAWMGSAVYLAFALEDRCELVVSEPNIQNQKMVDYECECGGVVEKPIDLPHKRAALVFFTKENFGKTWPIGPRRDQNNKVSEEKHCNAKFKNA